SPGLEIARRLSRKSAASWRHPARTTRRNPPPYPATASSPSRLAQQKKRGGSLLNGKSTFFLCFVRLLAMAVIVCASLAAIEGSSYAQSAVTLVQHTAKHAGTTTTTSLAFTNPNTAGNWITVCVRAGYSSSQVFTVKDSVGNAYRRA